MAKVMHGGSPRVRHEVNNGATTYENPNDALEINFNYEKAINILTEGAITAGASAAAAKVLEDE